MLSITRRLLSKPARVVNSYHHQGAIRGMQQKLETISEISLQEISLQPLEWRAEESYVVEPAKSVNNLFSNIKLPHNPWMAPNNWNSPHQDSYCSESVGLDGPDGNKLKLIKQYNPYGFVPTMVCNHYSQLIGVSFKDGLFHLITFDNDCNILTSNFVNTISPNSFGGGYFYLNHHNDTIVVKDHYHLACYNTSEQITAETNGKVGELELKWQSHNLKDKMKELGAPNVSAIYSTLPIWEQGVGGNKYWVLFAGEFDYDNNNTTNNPVTIPACLAVVEINPNDPLNQTKILDAMILTDQYVNNTLAADETGVYLVSNGVTKDAVDQKYKCNVGTLHKLLWRNDTGTLTAVTNQYENAGYRKYGMANIGSGTTPTIFKVPGLSGNYVAINDNANPQMNMCIYDANGLQLLSKTPVFDKMRSADEASFIAVNGRIVAENNFGHDLKNIFTTQHLANEPGMTLIDFNENDVVEGNMANIIWNKDETRFFAMSMLCRESGIVYAYTCDWDNKSSTEGGMFYISAIDSFDGRTVWKIPIGRGHPYQHSVGGIYFDRTGKNLFVGSYDYLVSIQNFDDE